MLVGFAFCCLTNGGSPVVLIVIPEVEGRFKFLVLYIILTWKTWWFCSLFPFLFFGGGVRGGEARLNHILCNNYEVNNCLIG